jgi:hypothetical protein
MAHRPLGRSSALYREEGAIWDAFTVYCQCVFQMGPLLPFSVLLLTMAHRALVKSSALYREEGAIWNTHRDSPGGSQWREKMGTTPFMPSDTKNIYFIVSLQKMWPDEKLVKIKRWYEGGKSETSCWNQALHQGWLRTSKSWDHASASHTVSCELVQWIVSACVPFTKTVWTIQNNKEACPNFRTARNVFVVKSLQYNSLSIHFALSDFPNCTNTLPQMACSVSLIELSPEMASSLHEIGTHTAAWPYMWQSISFTG